MDWNEFNLMAKLVSVHGSATDMDPRGHREQRRSMLVTSGDTSGKNRLSADVRDLFVSYGREEEASCRLRRDRRHLDDPRAGRRGNLRASLLALNVALTPQESIVESFVHDSPLHDASVSYNR